MLVGLIASHPTSVGTFVDYVCVCKTHRREGIARWFFSLLDTDQPVFLIAAAMSRPFKIYLKLGFELHKGPYEVFVGSASMAAITRITSKRRRVLPVLKSVDLNWEEVVDLLRRAAGITQEEYVRRMLCMDDHRMEYRCVYDTDLCDDELPKKKRHCATRV